MTRPHLSHSKVLTARGILAFDAPHCEQVLLVGAHRLVTDSLHPYE